MKKRTFQIMIVAMLVVSILAVMFIFFLDRAHGEFRDNVRVRSVGRTEKVMAIQNLQLNPTEKEEYTVDFTCDASGGYDFSIEYIETEDGGMKHFVNVTMYFSDEAIYTGSLAELIDSDVTVSFVGELHETKPTTVKFVYEMPYETGNEAQGTWADFKIRFSVEKN